MGTMWNILVSTSLVLTAIGIAGLLWRVRKLERAHRALLSYVDSVHHHVAADCTCKPHSQYLVSASFAETDTKG